MQYRIEQSHWNEIIYCGTANKKRAHKWKEKRKRTRWENRNFYSTDDDSDFGIDVCILLNSVRYVSAPESFYVICMRLCTHIDTCVI